MLNVMLVFIVSLFICGAIAYILGMFWFSDARNRRLLSFYLLGIEIFVWTLLNAITMVSSLEYYPVIYTLRMVMVCVIPFGVTWFILDFIGSPLKKKLWLRNIFIALPSLDIAFMATNPLHHLYFLDYSFPVPARAVLFWAHTGMDFLFILLASVLLVQYIAKEARKNPLLLLTGVGLLVPYAINLAYSFGYMLFPHDTTPIGFFVTFILFVFVASRSQLFSVKTALFSSTMNSIDDLIILCNEKLVITDINRSAVEMFGDFPVNPGRTKARDFLDYFSSFITETMPVDLMSSLKTDNAIDGECTISLPGREQRTYTLNWRKIYEGKKLSGYVMILKDVSSYREMISEINKQNDELLELTEKAESANRAKSDFLANMSHEIRTPINAIIGMTSIARSAGDPERKEYALEKIEDASAHLMGVISDILDMSKIEANKLELAPAIFDFEEMLRKIASIVHFRVAEKQQAFTVDIGKDIPRYLIGDDQRLSQVVTNLLVNAVKFTPERGSIKLKASLLNATDSACEIQVDVADTGVGVSDGQKARLFTSFGQAESGTTRKFGGSGLGLVISKRIVEMMGGRIWFTSELGKGSEFSFTMQARLPSKEDLAKLGDRESTGGSVAQADFAGFRVLLAEDMEVNREIVLALLEPTALRIDCAKNGLEAFQLFSENPDAYDLILMDVQMPEMDGYEATRKIRALGSAKAKEVPIIAITANVFREDIEKCLDSGMNGHLGKPLAYEDVLATLKQYLPAL